MPYLPDVSFSQSKNKSQASQDSEKYKEKISKIDISNRPCDWCGEPLGKDCDKYKNTIHSNCLKEEREFWLDIFY